ncbi:MAG: phage holin family protein [Chitinophagaceae bacterium]|nr:MAG: phage holin family protein [Chitinophagaceae bacterium]
MNFLLRFLLTSALGYLLFWYMPAGQFRDQPGTLLAAVAIGIIDSFIKPGRVTKRYPITVYTLLIVLTALNALLIKLCDRYIPGFEITGWGPALAVGFAMAALSLLIDRFVKAD